MITADTRTLEHVLVELGRSLRAGLRRATFYASLVDVMALAAQRGVIDSGMRGGLSAGEH